MRHRRAFTLVELLVVIVIICVLTGILLPVYSRSRRKALETTCFSNIKQIGAALLMYANDWDGCAPPYTTSLQDRVVLDPDSETPTIIDLAPFNDPAELKRCFAPYGAGSDELWSCPLDPHDPEWPPLRDVNTGYSVPLIFVTRRPVRLDAPPVVSVEEYDRMLTSQPCAYEITWVQSDDIQMPVPRYLVCCLTTAVSNNRADTTIPHGKVYPMLRLDGSVVLRKAGGVRFPSGRTLTGG